MKSGLLDFRECCFKTFPGEGRKLVWEITHECKFGCPYCFQARKRQQNPMRILHPTDLRVVVAKLPELEIKDVLITGGEIRWARESLPDICSRLDDSGITFSVSTNYVAETDFIDFLIDLSPRAFNISLDPRATETKDKYDRNIGRVEKVLEKCEGESIAVKATGVITRESLQHVDSYLLLLASLSEKYSNLTSIYITNPYDIGYVKTNIRPAEDSLRQWLKRMQLPEPLLRTVKFVNFHRFNAPLQSCLAGAKLMHVEPDGNVYPCHLFANLPKEIFLLGNIVKDSASELKKRLEDFAVRTKDALQRYKENDVCEKCRQKNECGGGCVAELVSIGQLVEPQLICKRIRPPSRMPLFTPKSQSSLPFKSGGDDLTQEEEDKITEHIRQGMRAGHDLAHGFDHVNCVVRYARFIGKREGANLRIVTCAAYFHDFEPRRKLIYESHAEHSAQRAVTFLRSIGLTEDELEQVYHCITTSFYGAEELGHTPLSIEAKCVRDADWLDAIGARGIARVFAFGVAHGCEELGEVEWDLDPPPKKTMSRIGPDPSPIYHFFSKLLWIRDSMSTQTGKQLAEERHNRMVKFLKEYRKEMNLEDIPSSDYVSQ